MEFNEKLQELRKSRGMTQEELAEALYVSRAAVSKWESGRGYPSIDSLKDISGFLAEHMHYAYVAFLIKGKLYVDDEHKIAVEDLSKIPKMKVPAKGIWQNLTNLDAKVVRENGIYRVAVLSGANGDMIGQVILGRPTTKTTLDRKDIVETEMIISLIGTMVGNGRRKS